MSPAPSPPREAPRLRPELRVEPRPAIVGTEPGVVATLAGGAAAPDFAADPGVDCAGTALAGARRPHSSQYPSAPYEPEQPGRTHLMGCPSP
ncbi:hypothetical protein GCM10023170_009100 [Phytohabitans houttuyneae]